MTRAARVALVASLASVGLAWAALTSLHAVAGLALAVALASLLRPRLSALSAPLQGLLLLACGLTGLALTSLLAFSPDVALADRALHRAWAVLGSGSLLLASARTHLRDPEGGVVATVGLGLLCLLACGSVLSGSVYLALLLPTLVLMFMAVRLADSDRTLWARFGTRHRSALLGVCAASGLASALLLAWIPGVYDRASAWALQMLDDEVRVGFHDGPMSLGSLRGMLDSDEIVLRVEGNAGERLRGNAYSEYADAVWRASLHVDPSEVALADGIVGEAADGDEVAVIRYASGEGDRFQRFFLPLQAEAIRLSPSRVRVDSYGIARPADEKSPQEARVRLGSVRRLVPAPPGPADRSLPESLRPPLEKLAAGWTRDATTPLERVRALQHRLESDYRYSLHFERRESADPLLQFLLHDRQGHCEYFASALTLLARASGVPARMVTGYRVSERNPFGDYSVVRERHAHAWAEVHLEGEGWVAVDASPIAGFEGAAARTTPWGPALVDWARVELRRRGPVPLLALLVVVFGGIQLRGLMAGRQKRGRVAKEAQTPTFIAELLRHLKARGWDRGDSETLEAFARRLPPAGELRRPADGAEELLARAAALRYGGEGSPRVLARDIRRWITQVEQSVQSGCADSLPSH